MEPISIRSILFFKRTARRRQREHDSVPLNAKFPIYTAPQPKDVAMRVDQNQIYESVFLQQRDGIVIRFFLAALKKASSPVFQVANSCCRLPPMRLPDGGVVLCTPPDPSGGASTGHRSRLPFRIDRASGQLCLLRPQRLPTNVWAQTTAAPLSTRLQMLQSSG